MINVIRLPAPGFAASRWQIRPASRFVSLRLHDDIAHPDSDSHKVERKLMFRLFADEIVELVKHVCTGQLSQHTLCGLFTGDDVISTFFTMQAEFMPIFEQLD
jgi:hypothetical protein